MFDAYAHQGFLEWRLRDWALHPAGAPAIELRPRTPWLSEARLTRAGARILRHGLERASDAPPLPVGGAVAYAGERPWLRVGGRSWRLGRATPPGATSRGRGGRRA